jgi:hypothetical protein
MAHADYRWIVSSLHQQYTFCSKKHIAFWRIGAITVGKSQINVTGIGAVHLATQLLKTDTIIKAIPGSLPSISFEQSQCASFSKTFSGICFMPALKVFSFLRHERTRDHRLIVQTTT